MEEVLQEILKEQKEIKKLLQTIIDSKEQSKNPANVVLKSVNYYHENSVREITGTRGDEVLNPQMGKNQFF